MASDIAWRSSPIHKVEFGLRYHQRLLEHHMKSPAVQLLRPDGNDITSLPRRGGALLFYHGQNAINNPMHYGGDVKSGVKYLVPWLASPITPGRENPWGAIRHHLQSIGGPAWSMFHLNQEVANSEAVKKNMKKVRMLDAKGSETLSCHALFQDLASPSACGNICKP